MTIDLNPDAVVFYGQLLVPVEGIITDTGSGKTSLWRTEVAEPLVTKGLHPILAVPLHRLGGEVVKDFAAEGIGCCDYRGRDADDPKAPGHPMCREQERVSTISRALGDISAQACQHGDKKCRYFEICGYQRQQRKQPQVSVVPHQMLFRQRPSFIKKPDALAIDESFWAAGLCGPEDLWLCLLKEDRTVPGDIAGTADLVAISNRVYAMLLRQSDGFIRRTAINAAGITIHELRNARRLEWRRKRDTKAVYPDMPLKQVKAICEAVMAHNQDVRRLATFWDLLIQTLQSGEERSPYLELVKNARTSLTASSTAPTVRMRWRADIHPSWRAPTTIMDATMSPEIVRQFFPAMPEPHRFSAPTPHVYIRQVLDRSMSASMLIPSDAADERTNRTRENNITRISDFIETRAIDVLPGRVLVISQLGLEEQLMKHVLPDNVEFGHFNAIAGQNAWKDVALLIVIGRTLPSPADVEGMARPLFGADIEELEPDTWYPLVERGVQMRDRAIVPIEGRAHPDPRVEQVRWQICEAGLMQAIGRGRGINRSPDNPLQIDVLTNVPLPIVTDELVSWHVIQPTKAELMRCRGAVPLNYRDMAAAYPDLFKKGAEAARKALGEENPGEMPIEEYLIRVSPGFLAIDYRRSGSRGPASTFLFDPKRIDPLTWLTERIGAVEIKGTARPLPISFKEYLQQRRLTDTPNGTFVEDARHDRMLPDVRTWGQLESYLLCRDACDEALAGGRTVWRQYVAKHQTDRAGKAK